MSGPARGELNLWWRIGVGIVGAVWRVFFRTLYLGPERIPRSGPAVVAANHVSALDGIVLALGTAQRARRMTRFLAAAEFFEKRRFAWALRLYRQIPLRRGQGDIAALDEAIRTVRDGALAGIFPEGRVNDGAELERGHTGVARIALAAGSAVVPAGIWGTQARWPRSGLTWRRPLRPTVVVAYGEPVPPEGDPLSPDDTQAFTARVMDAIAAQARLARAAAEERA